VKRLTQFFGFLYDIIIILIIVALALAFLYMIYGRERE